MHELKKKTIETINNINQSWVDEIKSAEKDGRGLDLCEIFGHFSEELKKLDQHFLDFEQRNSGKKKKGWLG